MSWWDEWDEWDEGDGVPEDGLEMDGDTEWRMRRSRRGVCGGTMREVVEGMVMRRAGDLCEGG